MPLTVATASQRLPVARFHLFYAPVAGSSPALSAASECQHVAGHLATIEPGFSTLIF
ncbi:MAG: hypothetical protein JZU64_03040 [Rhodoferax sp.]|nr:hypothetical protein [Rhodoferax sp.]